MKNDMITEEQKLQKMLQSDANSIDAPRLLLQSILNSLPIESPYVIRYSYRSYWKIAVPVVALLLIVTGVYSTSLQQSPADVVDQTTLLFKQESVEEQTFVEQRDSDISTISKDIEPSKDLIQ